MKRKASNVKGMALGAGLMPWLLGGALCLGGAQSAGAQEARPAALPAAVEQPAKARSEQVPANSRTYIALRMLSRLGFYVPYERGCFGENLLTRRELAEITRDVYAQFTGSLRGNAADRERVRKLLSTPSGRLGALVSLGELAAASAPELRAMGGPAALIPEQVQRAAEENAAALRQ